MHQDQPKIARTRFFPSRRCGTIFLEQRDPKKNQFLVLRVGRPFFLLINVTQLAGPCFFLPIDSGASSNPPAMLCPAIGLSPQQ